jgi:ABC-2 type transport system permease protein
MTGAARYLRLLAAFGRFSLASEMAFRANYVMKVLVEMLWLGILLVFFDTIFRYTGFIAGWDRNQYLFFLGCYYTLEGLTETFFLENASEFSDLVRTGNLDFYLLKPIDEQFLISLRKIDWSTAPKVVLGGVIMVYALAAMGWSFDPRSLLGMTEQPFNPWPAVAFVSLFFCGAALAYSFLLMLTSTSVWLVRNESLMELWWLFTTLMRYPRDIYRRDWAFPFFLFFSYVVPVLLVVSVPAETMLKALAWENVALIAAAAALMVYLSRRFFFHALRSYRSASS